ncbi:MAG: hypothetical protein MUD01_10760 [Chloroflexaceae bacterium]|jgi:uncharacterized membrane protein YfcA|nr:hypothetical protein [Chloroflexaceae bacterium]
MTKAYVWFQTKLNTISQSAKDEQGSQLVEKAGLAMAAAALIGVVGTLLGGGGGNQIAQSVVGVLNRWVTSFM